MRIAIDCKNQALYGGGIAHWANEVLPAWISSCPDDEIVLVTPEGTGSREVDLPCTRKVAASWYDALPLHLRHGIYDNFSFPRAIAKIQPDLVFSPYHDVRVPKNCTSIITVYDLCYLDAGDCYPAAVRAYRLWMLKLNLKRATHVITDSDHAKSRLVSVLGFPGDRVSVVPCSLPHEFLSLPPPPSTVEIFRTRMTGEHTGRKLLLYSGGLEYRKNVPGLLAALRKLWDAGEKISLLMTGTISPRWQSLFPEVVSNPERIRFLGRLSLEEMRLAYESTDAVIYPTFCEGFGRVCLEAMACGTPFACSDLEVLREVAGDYPSYFDPSNIQDIASAILASFADGRKPRRQDPRFAADAVRQAFLLAMEPIVQKLQARRV
jgi:glycosyltransferase involved in cell wall biosynthesis